MSCKRILCCLAVLSVAAAIAAVEAVAGPPLICHPFEIGDAKSLPWSAAASNGGDWRGGQRNYDLKRLVDDTLAILDSGAPVIVRMETLRRATIYAEHDKSAQSALFERLKERAKKAQGETRARANALFDFGYLVETYRQFDWSGLKGNPAAGADGYNSVVEAIRLKGGDPEMEFAAAVITTAAGAKSAAHLQSARAGAKAGSLLARNIATHFKASA